MAEQIADFLVLVAVTLILASACGLAVFMGRLRVRMKEVDPELYYSAGFDTSTMFAIQGGGPDGVQRFLLGNEYEEHPDRGIRLNASRVMLCRRLFVASFIMMLVSGAIRLIAT